MEKDKALVVFQGSTIRRTWQNGQRYFVALDIVAVLTDSVNPTDHLKKLRKQDETLDEGWEQIVIPLKIDTPGGAQIQEPQQLIESISYL